jgi:TIR domain
MEITPELTQRLKRTLERGQPIIVTDTTGNKFAATRWHIRRGAYCGGVYFNDLGNTYTPPDGYLEKSALPWLPRDSGCLSWDLVYEVIFPEESPVRSQKINEQGERMGQPEPQPTTVRVFISHSSQDLKVAKALVEVLEVALSLESNDIRCTSVPGYKLNTGEHTSVQLQKEISGAEVIIGIVTTNSMQSSYVLFELGASWGLNKPTFPLLACGADFSNLPGPLKERHASRLDKRHEIQQVIDDVVSSTRIERRSRVAAKLEGKIDSLLDSAMENIEAC